MSAFTSSDPGGVSRFGAGRVVVLLLVAVLLATAGRVSHAQATPSASLALGAEYLPPDTSFALLVRPAELAAHKIAQPVVDAVDALLKPAKMEISVADVDEFKFALLGPPPMRGPAGFYMVTRAKRAVDWKKPFDLGAGKFKEENVDGQKLYLRGREAIWLPDDRTLVVGQRDTVVRIMQSPDPNDRADWRGHWEKAAKSPLAGFLKGDMFKIMEFPNANGQPDRSLAALVNDVKFGVLAGRVTDKGFAVTAFILTNSNKASVRAAPVISHGLTSFASMIATRSRLQGDDLDSMTEQLTSLLEKTQIITHGETVEINALVTPKMLEVFATSARLMGGG